MLGRKNPLTELDGEEYKLAKEEGFLQGRRVGWFMTALMGIPAVAIATIATWGTLAAIFLPALALGGAVVTSAVFQMHAERRASKRAANLLLAQQGIMLGKEEKEGQGQAMAPEGPEQNKNAPNMAPQQPAPAGHAPIPPSAAPAMPASSPMGYAPPSRGAPMPMAQGYHGVANSPQMAAGRVVGPHTANFATRGAAPAQGVPVRS